MLCKDHLRQNHIKGLFHTDPCACLELGPRNLLVAATSVLNIMLPKALEPASLDPLLGSIGPICHAAFKLKLHRLLGH